MTSIPQSFLDSFKAEFGDEYRFRWSFKTRSFHLEQKVGRAALSPSFIDAADDQSIRARDGYALVLTLQPGDRMPCPGGCGLDLKVPVFTFKAVTCPRCKWLGRDGSYPVGYFPFSESLMDYLKYLDPKRGGQRRVVADADKRTRDAEEDRMKNISRQGEGALYDAYNRIAGIESVGFTGRERAWDRT